VTRFDASDWEEVVKAVGRSTEVSVACHVNPDGDALGSLLGTTLALRKAGKRAHASWGTDPLEVPEGYAFLPGAASIIQPRDVPPAETFLALDCGAEDRLGELQDVARRSDMVINIDHHPGNDNFGTLNVVVPSVSSTAELIAALIADVGIEVDGDIATCLYTGVVTDTGRFSYANTSPDALRLAADLVGRGVSPTLVASELWESSSFDYLKLLGRMLERATLCDEAGFVYSWITLDDLAATRVPIDSTEGLIDTLRSTRSADVAVMLKQQAGGTYRVSLRSKGPRSVGAIARAHGGGGHELAAGFTADDVQAAVEDIRRELTKSL
jgi:bifunctional oligoribonuclease and PAP phosphatase NrnA